MKNKTKIAALGMLCFSAASSAQNALDEIEIHVTEEMVEVATRILDSVQTGVPQQGDAFFTEFIGEGEVVNYVEQMEGYSREELLSLPLTDEARRDWSYWPRPRAGLRLDQMTAEQRAMVHDLLHTVLASTGYLKVVHIMQLEEILRMTEGIGLLRGMERYWLVFFGTPSMEMPWAWRFEGHHVSLSISVAPGGGVRVTPTFLGADPAEIRSGALTGFRPHAAVEDLGRSLARSLSAAEREIAVLSEQAPIDIFATNFAAERADWETWRRTLQAEGIAVADLDRDQQRLVRRILDEVVTTYRPEISSAYLESIDVDELQFAWMGSLERGRPHYYRLQGSDFVFEYDNAQNDGNHVHTVWRSKSGDFGDDLLRNHYGSSDHH